MKNLWCINLLVCFLLTGCISIKPRGISMVQEFPGKTTEAPLLTGVSIYKAVMGIGKRRLTGLMVIKRMDTTVGLQEEKPKFRIVFANEIGMTYFDLAVMRDSMKVISCFSSLNRKKFLDMITGDFRLITGLATLTKRGFYRQNNGGNLVIRGKSARFRVWYEYNTTGDTLTTLSARSNLADPVFIRFGEWKSDGWTKMNLRQPVIGLNLELRRLKYEP